MSEEALHAVAGFQGVYLLVCLNPRHKGRTYIGYTVDPARRLKQHNTGSHAGGAYRTSGKGPWKMVLIIHGFPNNISALRFEWAWQHPERCRRLRGVPVSKRSSESALQHRWRIVCHMLHARPWLRLPLCVRWLHQDMALDFPAGLHPPLHMALLYGPVTSKRGQVQDAPRPGKSGDNSKNARKGTSSNSETEEVASQEAGGETQLCTICKSEMGGDGQRLSCFWRDCGVRSHMTCLAGHFLRGDPGQLVPMEGSCPGCQRSQLWGRLIEHHRGWGTPMITAQQADCEDAGADSSHWMEELAC